MIVDCPQVVTISDIPHFDRGVPGPGQQSERNVRDEGQGAHVLSMAFIYTLATADRH